MKIFILLYLSVILYTLNIISYIYVFIRACTFRVKYTEAMHKKEESVPQCFSTIIFSKMYPWEDRTTVSGPGSSVKEKTFQ